MRANGVELHYLECGSGEPLVLVHGGSGDYQSWQRQLAAFSRRFRVIAYSRRYSYPNRNRLMPGHSVYLEANDLTALIEKLVPERPHLVGHSYGALTALVASLERPDLARSLVLAEPPLHGWVNDVPGGKALIEQMAVRVRMPARQAFEQGRDLDAMRIFTDGICGHGYLDALPRSERARRLRNARAVQVLMQSPGAFPALSRERARRMAVPTLIVEGEHTVPLHRYADDELLRCIPGCRRSVIPDATHWVPTDNPQEFNRTVLSFLTRGFARQAGSPRSQNEVTREPDQTPANRSVAVRSARRAATS